jgi:succinate dehydrogenase/fumarate reductase cytochrome b subunit
MVQKACGMAAGCQIRLMEFGKVIALTHFELSSQAMYTLIAIAILLFVFVYWVLKT